MRTLIRPRGLIHISNGDVTVDAQGDALSAYTDVIITGGAFALSAGGGAQSSVADGQSAKGVKSGLPISLSRAVRTASQQQKMVCIQTVPFV